MTQSNPVLQSEILWALKRFMCKDDVLRRLAGKLAMETKERTSSNKPFNERCSDVSYVKHLRTHEPFLAVLS